MKTDGCATMRMAGASVPSFVVFDLAVDVIVPSLILRL